MPYYGYYYGVDLGYYAVVLASIVLGGLAQAFIKSTYRKWSTSAASISGTGRRGRAAAGIDEGRAPPTWVSPASAASSPTTLTRRDEMLHLSDANFGGSSVASVAVACHEAGHAVQRQRGFGMYRLRTALVPVVSAAESLWTVVLLAGRLP